MLRGLKYIEEADMYWITGFHTVNPNLKWFDPSLGKWLLYWKEWLNEISRLKAEMPDMLLEPQDFPIKADYVDTQILSRLEINGRESLKKIAQRLDLTPPDVSYHFNEHILKKGLIGQWSIIIRRFEDICDRFFFFFSFNSEEKMARFARSMFDKPFVYGVSRICGENTLIAHLIMPSCEFSKFLSCLLELKKRGLLQSYDYLIEDQTKIFGRTIAYEYFKNGEWIYNHQKHIKSLKKIISIPEVAKLQLAQL
jgi:DNA-binding Lrp family transcriptional regulator